MLSSVKKIGYVTVNNNNNINQLLFSPYLFLIPLKNSKGLLVPIEINSYVMDELINIQTIFSKLSFDNLVKIWLTHRLLIDGVVVNGILNNHKLLKYIKLIKLNAISLKDFDIPKLFEFKENVISLLKVKDRVAGCYIIMFKNRYYYYIGSSTNLKQRINTYNSTLNNLNGKNFLNVKLNWELKSLILWEDFDVDYEINVLYLTNNYINLFESYYPDYKLNKGEYILLKKITDFYIKVLETSLINTYTPLLNMANAGYLKHVNWEDDYLKTYSKNYKDYDKHNKYSVYLERREEGLNRDILKYMSEKEMGIYRSGFIRTGTLNDICKRYYLREEEVLANLNKYHNYFGAKLRNPIKIIIDEIQI